MFSEGIRTGKGNIDLKWSKTLVSKKPHFHEHVNTLKQ